jgi:hypothetical protein
MRCDGGAGLAKGRNVKFVTMAGVGGGVGVDGIGPNFAALRTASWRSSKIIAALHAMPSPPLCPSPPQRNQRHPHSDNRGENQRQLAKHKSLRPRQRIVKRKIIRNFLMPRPRIHGKNIPAHPAKSFGRSKGTKRTAIDNSIKAGLIGNSFGNGLKAFLQIMLWTWERTKAEGDFEGIPFAREQIADVMRVRDEKCLGPLGRGDIDAAIVNK